MYYITKSENWAIFLQDEIVKSFRLHPTNARSLLSVVEEQQKEAREKARLNPKDASIMPTEEWIEKDEEEKDDFGGETFNQRKRLHAELAPPLVIKPQPLDIDHPLFGTDCLSWPLVIWDQKAGAIGNQDKKSIQQFIRKCGRSRDKSLNPQEQLAMKEGKKLQRELDIRL